MTTPEIRDAFLVENLMQAGSLQSQFTDLDRMEQLLKTVAVAAKTGQ